MSVQRKICSSTISSTVRTKNTLVEKCLWKEQLCLCLVFKLYHLVCKFYHIYYKRLKNIYNYLLRLNSIHGDGCPVNAVIVRHKRNFLTFGTLYFKFPILLYNFVKKKQKQPLNNYAWLKKIVIFNSRKLFNRWLYTHF